jgi:hypothetical protein
MVRRNDGADMIGSPADDTISSAYGPPKNFEAVERSFPLQVVEKVSVDGE